MYPHISSTRKVYDAYRVPTAALGSIFPPLVERVQFVDSISRVNFFNTVQGAWFGGVHEACPSLVSLICFPAYIFLDALSAGNQQKYQ